MALFDLLTLSTPGKIGDIEIAATLEETHHDALEVTEHPVESGAAITDHSYKRPPEVTLTCAWSNSSLDALKGSISSAFAGGNTTSKGYIGGIYDQLLTLQESRVPFTITTSKREYKDMLMTSLSVTTDQKTSNALMVTATCRQIIRVYTAVVTVGPASTQADPESTAAVEKSGPKQPKGRTPSPGGAVPPFDAGSGAGWDNSGANLPAFDAGSGKGW